MLLLLALELTIALPLEPRWHVNRRKLDLCVQWLRWTEIFNKFKGPWREADTVMRYLRNSLFAFLSMHSPKGYLISMRALRNESLWANALSVEIFLLIDWRLQSSMPINQRAERGDAWFPITDRETTKSGKWWSTCRVHPDPPLKAFYDVFSAFDFDVEIRAISLLFNHPV